MKPKTIRLAVMAALATVAFAGVVLAQAPDQSKVGKAPAKAGNVVSLNLIDATMQDIAAELEAQTEIKFNFVGRQVPPGDETRIARFKVDNRPFKEVLRAACEQTGYSYRRVGPSQLYWLEPGKLRKSPYRVKLADYAVAVDRMTLSGESRGVSFEEGTAEVSHSPPRLSVELSVEDCVDDSAQMLYGIKDVRVRHDTGKESFFKDAGGVTNAQFFQNPDRADFNFSFEPPPPTARRIASLNGTLIFYQKSKTYDFRFDDLDAKDVAVNNAGIEVVLKSFRMSARNVNVDLTYRALAGPLAGIADQALGGLPEPPQDDRFGLASLVLLEKDGRAFRHDIVDPRHTIPVNSSASWSIGVGAPEGFKPVALVVQLVHRSDPTREVPFTIQDIPLPE